MPYKFDKITEIEALLLLPDWNTLKVVIGVYGYPWEETYKSKKDVERMIGFWKNSIDFSTEAVQQGKMGLRVNKGREKHFIRTCPEKTKVFIKRKQALSTVTNQ